MHIYIYIRMHVHKYIYVIIYYRQLTEIRGSYHMWLYFFREDV